ncbi:hypothetical protein SDC9_78770 [bioreactor metagenome]|uniref:Uncharacterized protein n=1 Tax=bioreactor metagenome TaxID=1076179 RepID=A0A644YUE3_9ZZZZ
MEVTPQLPSSEAGLGAVVGRQAGCVVLLERSDFLAGEVHREGGGSVSEMMRLGCPDNGCGDNRIVQHPGQGNLCHRDISSFRYGLHGIDGALVGLQPQRPTRGVGAGVGPAAGGGALAPRSGHQTRGQRRPRDRADALVCEQGVHLAFLLACNEVVLILHRDELGPVVQFGGVLHLGELPGPHGGGADVTRLAGLHHVVECLHCLFDRGVRIEAVDLVQVDVVGAEPLQRGVDLFEDRPS